MNKKPRIKWFIRWDTVVKRYFLVDDQDVRRKEGPTPGALAEFAFDRGADEVVHQYDHIAVALGLAQP